MSASAADEKAVLNILDLKFAYFEPRWTINKLSLTVKSGEIVTILGASGCGKSTLLNLIAGLLFPQEGRIELAAQEAHRQQIGYIFQNDALFPWRTVSANLMLATVLNKGLSKEAAQERIKYYLNAFHLNEQVLKQYPSQLSGGMRQRVSIIQSLMFDPELLLLDEPFSALDFYTKLRLENEFYQLIKEKKKAALLVTHDIEEAIAMSDRVFIMDRNGALVHEFIVNLTGKDRLPENARGTPRFAELYRSIWSELKTVIAE